MPVPTQRRGASGGRNSTPQKPKKPPDFSNPNADQTLAFTTDLEALWEKWGGEQVIIVCAICCFSMIKNFF